MAEDPAQTFAERRQRAEQLIDDAFDLELQVIDDDGSVFMQSGFKHLVLANHFRLCAICEDLGLRGSPAREAEPEGEDPADGGLE